MVSTDLNTHASSYVTVTELAEYWEVTRQLVYKHIQSGLLPAMRLGPRCVRVRTHDAREFERGLSSWTKAGAPRRTGRGPKAIQLIHSADATKARKQDDRPRERRVTAQKDEADGGA